MKLQLAAALLASASLLSGCASDSPGGPLEDCESCDVDVSKLEAYQEIGLVCGMLPGGVDITCVGVQDTRNSEPTTFEGDLYAYAAPSGPSDSVWVERMGLLAGVYSLNLGPDYRPGSSFALGIFGGSMFVPEANDWLPFETVAGLTGASDDAGQGAPADDSWINQLIVANADALDPEMLVFPVELPFERWQVQVFGVHPRLAYELIYSVPGADESVRVPLNVEGGSSLASVIAAEGAEGVDVRIGDGPVLRLTGPAALVVEYDETTDDFGLRLATDEDLSFGSLFD